jgi:hypothetical protein
MLETKLIFYLQWLDVNLSDIFEDTKLGFRVGDAELPAMGVLEFDRQNQFFLIKFGRLDETKGKVNSFATIFEEYESVVGEHQMPYLNQIVPPQVGRIEEQKMLPWHRY